MKPIICFILLAGLAVGATIPDRKSGPNNVVGGPRPVDVEDEAIVSVAKRAVEVYNAEHAADADSYRMVRVVGGTKQVVAGMKYVLTLELLDTTTQQSKMVEAAIWSRPWLRNPKIQFIVTLHDAAIRRLEEAEAAVHAAVIPEGAGGQQQEGGGAEEEEPLMRAAVMPEGTGESPASGWGNGSMDHPVEDEEDHRN